MPFIKKIIIIYCSKAGKKGQKVFKDKFNIPTPLHGRFITPNVMLVPLLAFDKNKNRLGYGGGFYDRTISNLENKKSFETIGIAFNEQEIESLPSMNFDKTLNKIITPKGIIQ